MHRTALPVAFRLKARDIRECNSEFRQNLPAAHVRKRNIENDSVRFEMPYSGKNSVPLSDNADKVASAPRDLGHCVLD
jgi:hypothetical protein